MHSEGAHFQSELNRLSGLNLLVGRTKDIEFVGPGLWSPWTQLEFVGGTSTGTDLFVLNDCGIRYAGGAIESRICFHNDSVSICDSHEEKQGKNP